MVAANLNKMVEKNGDLLECERREIFWKCVGDEKLESYSMCRVEEIGCTPSSTGSLYEPVLKV